MMSLRWVQMGCWSNLVRRSTYLVTICWLLTVDLPIRLLALTLAEWRPPTLPLAPAHRE